MRRVVALILALLALAQPCVALTPGQEVGAGLPPFGYRPTYYANPALYGSVPPGLAYSSAGGRWCWNAAPALMQLAANVPCFDHNPSTGAALGLRSEPQRTNLFLNNTAPALQTVPVASGTTYTISFYGTGAITWTGACTGSLTGTGATTLAQTSCTTATTSLVIATLTGSVVYPQVEASAFATSRILTAGAAVPVSADVWTPTGAAARQILSGQACVAMQVLLEGQNGGALLEANDGTFSNRVYENFNTASQTVGLAVIGGAQQQPYSNTGGSALTAPRTAVIAYGNGAVIEGYDGTAPVSLAQSGGLTGMTTAKIGSSNLGAPALYGWIQQMMVRPSCTAAQVRRYSTAGANLQAANDNEWPMFAANDNLPVIVKIASGGW